MHGISKPNRNIFELSVLLNYFLTRYSGSDGKVPCLFFLFSLHIRCLARPVCILLPAFHLLPRAVPLWNMKPCQLLGPAIVYRYVQWDEEMICKMMEKPRLPVYRNSSSSQGLGAYRLRFVPAASVVRCHTCESRGCHPRPALSALSITRVLSLLVPTAPTLV